MKNILLIGMPGTGKSTVGVVLAKHIGYDFVDTDLLISKKHNRPLSKLVEEKGYERFIEIEGRVGSELDCNKTVIATGGSMVLSNIGMKSLSERAITVWLDTPLEELDKRLKGAFLQRGIACPMGYTLQDIWNQRKPYYEKYSQIRINCFGSADDVAKEIMKKIETFSK